MLKQLNLDNYYNDFRETYKVELEPEDWENIDEIIHEYNLERLERI